jgi:hypothetical protein
MGLLTAVAAVATVGGLYFGNKATKQQAKANELQRRQANLAASQNRRQQVRQNRLALASSQVSAEGGGVARSSGAYGGQGSIQNQGLSNLSYLDQMNKLSDQASSAMGKAIKLGGYASMFAGAADLAMTFRGQQSANDQVADKSPKKPAPITYKGSHPTQSNNVGPGLIW